LNIVPCSELDKRCDGQMEHPYFSDDRSDQRAQVRIGAIWAKRHTHGCSCTSGSSHRQFASRRSIREGSTAVPPCVSSFSQPSIHRQIPRKLPASASAAPVLCWTWGQLTCVGRFAQEAIVSLAI
jgi:hypothetical protein